MSFEFGKLVELLKVKTRYWVAAWFVVGGVLVAPKRWMAAIELEEFRSHSRPAFFIAFLLITAYVLAAIGAIVGGKLKAKREANEAHEKSKAELETLHKSLKNLSIEEKQLLCRYIFGKTKTQSLPVTDGVVQGLVGLNVLYRASNLGHLTSFAYNIQPWAWDYLNEHPEVISEGVPIDRDGRIIPYEP